MVARGDLGLEMPLEQVPRVQKHIIRRARAAGRAGRFWPRRCSSRCASSRGRPGPRSATPPTPWTRAPTRSCWPARPRSARYPVRAVETLDAIIRDAESMPPRERIVPEMRSDRQPHGRAVCEAAVDARVDGARRRDRRGHARGPHGAAAGVAAALDAGVRGDRERRTWSAPARCLWGVTPLLTTASDIDELEHLLVDAPAGAQRIGRGVRQRQRRAESHRRQLRQRAAVRLSSGMAVTS